MIKRVQEDPAFAEQLVGDFLQLKEDNQSLMAQIESVKQLERESQQALRQARGFSVYLKGKQGSLRKIELERQNSLRQAQEETVILKMTNRELRERLDEAKKIEKEAKLALRQARGVTTYLKQKSASLEKQLEATKAENEAKLALQQARTYKYNVKSTMMDNGLACSDHSRDLMSSGNSISTAGTFDVEEFEEFEYHDAERPPVPEELQIEMNGQ